MAFGDEIRSDDAPANYPTGIGGDANTIWSCDRASDKVYELSTSDFSIDREAALPHTEPGGIGGDANTIFHCDYGINKVYELSTTDFSVDREAASPSSYPQGIGGDANTIWHCDSNAQKVYELSITDFSVDGEAASPSTNPSGIGGDVNTIFHCDRDADKVYDLSITDFGVDREAASPSSYPQGIGGDINTIWHVDEDAQKVYELDAAAPATTHGTYHGTITDTGGENCDFRGFVWDTVSRGDPGNVAPGDSDYTNYWTEGNSYGVGPFSHQVTGLPQGATFYVRACAHNSAGWSYGGQVSFETPAGVDYEKTLTESLGLVDTYSRTWSAHQTYSELLGLADVVSKGVVQHPLVEALGLSDTVVKEPGKVLEESLGLLDVYSRTWAAHKTYTELLGLVDTITKDVSFPLTESLGLLDTVVKAPALIKTESLGLEDRLTKHPSKALVEVLGLLDSISYGKNLTVLANLIRKYIQLENIGGGGER